jgi:hypothetical protein
MTSFNLDPGHTSRSNSLKWVGLGAALLLIAGGGAAAYASYASHSTGGGSAAATAAATPALALGTVSGAPGVPTDVPVRLVAGSGVGSVSFTITYDPKVVTVSDARPDPATKAQLTWHHDAAQGMIVMLLTSPLSTGLSGDATLAILTMTAVDGAVGQVSPLTLHVRSAVHADGKDATLDATSGSFRNGVPGDVNGDGKVDATDYLRLASYLVGDETQIVALNADLNGDGKVTEADAVLLLQQLNKAGVQP